MSISFNPAVSNNKYQNDDYHIKRRLQELGLQSTGSKDKDLKAIEEAEKKKDTEATDKVSQPQQIQQNEQTQQAPQTPPEIASFMRSIGAEPTNSKEGDALAVETKLKQLETQAANPTDINTVNNLRSEWQQLTEAAPSQGADLKQSGSGDAFAGQDQLAKLNKHFLMVK